MTLNRFSLWMAFVLSILTGCAKENSVAGGSSGVENPEVVLSFTASGTLTPFTGSLRIYPAEQNPALDPDAVSQIRLDGKTTVTLSRLDFNRHDSDASAAFNILVTGTDSSGAMVRNLVYHPAARKFTGSDSQVLTMLTVPVEKLVRFQASLDRASLTKLERVFIPGSPFQSVVVDSQFVFDGIPSGVYPLRMIRKYVEEIRLPDSLNTDAPTRFRVDTAAPAIPRPPLPPPDLRLNAGADHSVAIQTPTLLSGTLTGAGLDDPRLALTWRPIGSTNPAVVVLESPGQLETKVTLPQTGNYRFALIATYGMNLPVEDTVTLEAWGTPFVHPSEGDTLAQDAAFTIDWIDNRNTLLTLQYTVNGGGLWDNIATNLPSQAGFNSYTWTPTKAPYDNCYLRFLGPDNVEVARSVRFVLRTP